MARTASAARGLNGSPPARAVPAMTFVQTVGRFETRPSLSSVPSGGARTVTALIPKFLQHERQLASDVVSLGAGFQLFRQDVPGVGLDLEMGRERRGLERPQRLDQRPLGRAERAEIREKDRDMAMDAP